MKGSPLQRLDQRLRHALPVALVLLMILVVATPMHLPGFASVAPHLPLIGIYYWSMYRPDLMRPSAAFILGAVCDIVAGTPIGVSSLVFLATLAAAEWQRRALGKSFLTAWWGFALVGGAAMALDWAMVSLVAARLMPARAELFQYLMTLAFYPLLGWGFARAQLALLRRA